MLLHVVIISVCAGGLLATGDWFVSASAWYCLAQVLAMVLLLPVLALGITITDTVQYIPIK